MGVRLFSGVLLALASCLLVHAFDAQIAVDSLTPTSISFAQYQTDHAPGTTPPGSPNAVHVTVMHINDLYELIPSGTLGGVARLKTMLNGLEQLNPNTISVLAGDLFSPSALSSVAISSMGGQPFDGIQMVTVANEFGLDYATLGNHETDVTAAEFAVRIGMSAFPWLCVNVMNTSYTNIRPAAWKGFTTPDGKRSAKVGIYGITLDSNNRTYQSYDTFENSIPKAQSIVQSLRTDTGADVVIGLTHLPYWHDQTMSSTIDAGDVIMGGHEHIRIAIPPANGLPGIYKADSNVHSAWVHDIYVDPTLPKTDPNHLVITSVLVDVDQSLTADPTLSAQVQSWVDLAFEGFTEAGFAPAAYLATPTEDLVGTNDVIFSNATTLTKLFNLACVEECLKYGTDTFTVPPIDGTLFNAGAIRIDDTIPAQTSMIQYDAIRISPYLNAVMLVKMTGAILKQALDTSESKLGNSQHLHTYPNITVDASSPSGYTVNGSPLDPSVDRWYVMGVLKFLMRGKAPYAFLVSGPQVVILAGDFAGDDPHADVRKSLIDQIALAYNPPGGNGDDDGPARVLGLRIPVFILVLVAGLVILACMVYGCLRHRRNRGPKRGADERRIDDRTNINMGASPSDADFSSFP